jgi:hypothetical protein
MALLRRVDGGRPPTVPLALWRAGKEKLVGQDLQDYYGSIFSSLLNRLENLYPPLAEQSRLTAGDGTLGNHHVVEKRTKFRGIPGINSLEEEWKFLPFFRKGKKDLYHSINPVDPVECFNDKKDKNFWTGLTCLRQTSRIFPDLFFPVSCRRSRVLYHRGNETGKQQSRPGAGNNAKSVFLDSSHPAENLQPGTKNRSFSP